MKRVGWVLVLGVCFLGLSGVCEASQLSSGIRSVWGYLFAPINCLGNYGAELLASTTKFVVCVLANANPANLIP